MGRRVRGVLALAAAGAVTLLALSVARYQSNERQTACFAMTYNLAVATRMYLMDWHETPNPRLWSDQLAGYMKHGDAFPCPEAKGLRCAYALNSGTEGLGARLRFSDRRRGQVSGPVDFGRLVTIFESDRGWNAHGGRELLPAKPRHFDGDHFGFLDGHAKWVARGDASVPLDWNASGARH